MTPHKDMTPHEDNTAHSVYTDNALSEGEILCFENGGDLPQRGWLRDVVVLETATE